MKTFFRYLPKTCFLQSL